MKLLQLWKFGGSGRDADNLADAIGRAQQHGFDGLLVKALDGTEWMSAFDSGADAIASSDQVAAQRDACHAAGLKYYVWTNPLHNVDLDVQATRTAAAALASDGIFLDVEPFAGPPPFWGPLRPPGLADGFMRRVRELAPDVWIALQPDPRPGRLAEIRPEEWFPYINAFAGQHYWTDFSPSAESWATRARLELSNAAEIGRHWNKPVLPTLPGISNATAFPIDMLRDFPGFVVFRLGTTSSESLNLLGSIPANDSVAPGPPPHIDPFDSIVNSLAYVCDTLGDQLTNVASSLNGQGDSVRNIVTEMHRVRAQFIGARPDVTGGPAAPAPAEPPAQPVPEAAPAGPVVTYNAGTPGLTQPNDWACSVFSSTMALQSVGVDKDWTTVRAELAGAVTEQWGLMNSNGSTLVELFRQNGFEAAVIANTEHGGATWDDVVARAGRMPVLLGGQRWNHWTFVRRIDDNGNLVLGNPAPTWRSVGTIMDRNEFANLGAWTMVWIELSSAPPEEDPVQISQLQSQINELQSQIQGLTGRVDGLTQGLAHVSDVIVPELAAAQTSDDRRAELARTVAAIREQFIGPAPVPA
ncbi:MAG TPA: hypothetical protein VGL99_07735 [Chloroflexota bacterium]